MLDQPPLITVAIVRNLQQLNTQLLISCYYVPKNLKYFVEP